MGKKAGDGINFFTAAFKRNWRAPKEEIKVSGNKDTKESAVVTWHDIVTRYSSCLYIMGISPDSITNYLKEPWTLNNIRKATKWFNTQLVPELDEINKIIASYEEAEWTRLFALNPNHSDILRVKKYKNKINNIWKQRPRFPKDIGRSTQEGY